MFDITNAIQHSTKKNKFKIYSPISQKICAKRGFIFFFKNQEIPDKFTQQLRKTAELNTGSKQSMFAVQDVNSHPQKSQQKYEEENFKTERTVLNISPDNISETMGEQ